MRSRSSRIEQQKLAQEQARDEEYYLEDELERQRELRLENPDICCDELDGLDEFD